MTKYTVTSLHNQPVSVVGNSLVRGGLTVSPGVTATVEVEEKHVARFVQRLNDMVAAGWLSYAEVTGAPAPVAVAPPPAPAPVVVAPAAPEMPEAPVAEAVNQEVAEVVAEAAPVAAEKSDKSDDWKKSKRKG